MKYRGPIIQSPRSKEGEEHLEVASHRNPQFEMVLEAISKIGFWFKVKAAARFPPEEYSSVWRIGTERPTLRLGPKTFLR